MFRGKFGNNAEYKAVRGTFNLRNETKFQFKNGYKYNVLFYVSIVISLLFTFWNFYYTCCITCDNYKVHKKKLDLPDVLATERIDEDI